jgi:hypothetical protein
MTAEILMKSSSRSGRFKKKLVSEAELLREAPVILEQVAPFHELYASGALTAAEFAAAYVILYLAHRYPGTWPGARRASPRIAGTSWRRLPFRFEPNVARRLAEVETLPEIFAGFALRSTPLAVNRALLQWLAGNYKLELMFRIPSPAEVLRQQRDGRRCVTVLVDSRIARYVLAERDALSFTMHDLIHADHFYFDIACYEGQLGFYGLVDRTFDYFDLSRPEFAAEFEYVIADMNAYAIHLLKCLKSAMIHYFNEAYFNDWLAGLQAPRSLYLLNSPAYSAIPMDEEILHWLTAFKSTGCNVASSEPY